MMVQRILRLGAVTLGLVAPQVAAADWVYRAPAASDDQGSAQVTNAQGITLDVGCAPSGDAVLTLTPAPRAAAQYSAPTFFFVVDGGPQLQWLADCDAHSCRQTYAVGSDVVPMSRISAVISALRAGTTAEVLLAGKPIMTFPLAGSSAALGRMRSTTGCTGF